MKLKKTKPLRVLGVAGEGNPHIFLGCGDEERNPFFWQKGGWNFLKSTPQRVKFCYSNKFCERLFKIVLDGL